MEVPHGELSYRIVRSPHGDPALSGFYCGFRRRERGVNRLVRLQYRGKALHRPTVLVMEEHIGNRRQTVGLSAWRVRVLPSLGRTSEAQVYIHLIGISRRYRGGLTPEGTPLGQALLAETLRRIYEEPWGAFTPIIWALVARRNDRSARMFTNTGFELVAPERQRRAGMPLWLMPKWSFPGDAIRIRGLPQDALLDADRARVE